MAELAAGVLAGASVAVALSRPPNPLRRLNVDRTAGPWGAPQLGQWWQTRTGMVTVGALVGIAAAVVAGPAAGVLAGGAAVATIEAWRRRRRRDVARHRQRDVVAGCLALASELEAGSAPARALSVVAADWPELFTAAAGQAALGGDPAVAFREISHRDGAQAMVAVGVAWQVAERTGARLAPVLAAVADSLRAEAAVDRETQSQLASVRATCRLMAVLPVGTVGVFSLGDASALRFLTSTSAGLVCAALAAGFIVAGLAWVRHVTSSLVPRWHS